MGVRNPVQNKCRNTQHVTRPPEGILEAHHPAQPKMSPGRDGDSRPPPVLLISCRCQAPHSRPNIDANLRPISPLGHERSLLLVVHSLQGNLPQQQERTGVGGQMGGMFEEPNRALAACCLDFGLPVKKCSIAPKGVG